MVKARKPERWLGVRLTVTLEAVMEMLGEARKWVENQFSEPEARMRELRRKMEQMNDFITEERSLETDRKVEKGRLLWYIRALNGPVGWDQVLHSQGICRRTAHNLLALSFFAYRCPELYEKFKRLGPTKLYRLARLHPDALKDWHMDAEVPTERGVVKLRNLTDRELEAHIRRTNPPRIRTVVDRLKAACISMGRMIQNMPKAPPRQDLVIMRDVLREAAGHVLDMLEGAA